MKIQHGSNLNASRYNRTMTPTTDKNVLKENFEVSSDTYQQTHAAHNRKEARLNSATFLAALAPSAVIFAGSVALGMAGGGAPIAAVGGAITATVGFGTGKLILDAGSWLTKRLLKPNREKLTQLKSDLRPKREAYRNALLMDINDKAVESTTKPAWGKIRDSEKEMPATSAHYTSTLREQLEDLALLADSRKSTGWAKKLAEFHSDPAQFRRQHSFLSSRDDAATLFASYETKLKEGKTLQEAFGLIRKEAHTNNQVGDENDNSLVFRVDEDFPLRSSEQHGKSGDDQINFQGNYKRTTVEQSGGEQRLTEETPQCV